MNANASKLITLSCQSCGAKLEITPNLDRFACSFCGQEHIVNRSGGTISLSPVVEAIHQVRAGVDKTAAELAIVRLQKEISDLQVERQNILKLSPPPTTNGVSILLIIIGVILIVNAFILFNPGASVPEAASVNGSICGGTGVISLFIGVLLIFQLPRKKLDWKQSTGTRINELARQIAEKQAELERNKGLVRG